MGKILEADLIIRGSDQTAAAFAGVIKHAQELNRTLQGMRGLGLADPKFKEQTAQINAMTRALRGELAATEAIARANTMANRAVEARIGLMGRLQQRFAGLAQMSGMGWMMGGIASGRLAHKTASDTAEFMHQRAMLSSTTGMTADEVREAVDKAMSMRVMGMSAADNLKAIGELRMVFGSTAEAIENANAVQKAAAMMQAVNPHMNAHDESYNLARALELKGVSMDPAHFMRLTDRIVQAINASRGKVTGESMFEFTQYARGAARNLSDDFYTRVVPSLVQEMRPTSAGRAISALYEQVIGAKMKLQSATEWMRLGLLDPKKVELNKIGNVKRIHPGAFVDSALMIEDPYAWVQGYLKPALARAGITDKNKVSEELAHLFSNQYAEQLAGILLTQSQRIEKDWRLNQQAPDTKALPAVRGADPLSAARDLGAAINTLLSAFGSPLAGHAIAVMNKMSDYAKDIGQAYGALSKSHPLMTEGASAAGAIGLGYVGLKGLQATFGLLTGSTALKGSAVALTQSAAALDAAAARLGSVPGVAQAAASGAPAMFSWATALPPRIAMAVQLWKLTQNAREHALKAPHITWDQKWQIMSGQRTADEMVFQGADYNFTLADIRKRLGGEEAFKALEGHADITTTVKVEPSPDFITRVENSVVNAIKGLFIDGTPPRGTAGSTGAGMPEALPGGAH